MKTGTILYEGPSTLDGNPIVVIATFRSKNRKTGDMIQTWIMRSDMSPVEAIRAKADASVCGGCPHRTSIGGGCYVEVARAPLTVWKAYKRGGYPRLDGYKQFAGRKLRMGAYGDPAAVPAAVWEALLPHCDGWTGYSHQRDQPEVLKWVMVSTDTPAQTKAHNAKGHRTFRVKTADQPLLKGEIECPADSRGMTCMECGLCAGQGQAGPSIAINVHGSLAGRYLKKYGKAA